ncbi:4380_t:CDS:2, partial [Gigaspora rosea]
SKSNVDTNESGLEIVEGNMKLNVDNNNVKQDEDKNTIEENRRMDNIKRCGTRSVSRIERDLKRTTEGHINGT